MIWVCWFQDDLLIPQTIARTRSMLSDQLIIIQYHDFNIVS
jgi:hypothetical protein